jgi:hypothetical protein
MWLVNARLRSEHLRLQSNATTVMKLRRRASLRNLVDQEFELTLVRTQLTAKQPSHFLVFKLKPAPGLQSSSR